MPKLLWAAPALGSLLIAGCGSSGIDFSGQHRAAPPVNLSVYVSRRHLQLSPRRVGAGPVVFEIANQAPKREQIVITRPDGRAVAATRPIDASGTAQVTVDFTSGQYELSARPVCATCGDPLNRPRSPVTLTIGPARAAGDSALLQP